MNAEKLIAAIQAVEIPENLDLTTDELNAIKAEAAEPFELISLAFQCGFMRGQSAAFKPLDLEPVKQGSLKMKPLQMPCKPPFIGFTCWAWKMA